MENQEATCELCRSDGGEVLWRDAHMRVVWAPQPEHPGFCRVIQRRHVKEMTDLTAQERSRLMVGVFAVEQALRDVLQPDKINLASFGNVVPHLHWHVIARFSDDPHFPDPVWGARRDGRRRPVPADFVERMRAVLDRLCSKRER
ncbi:MAG TPA: HIT family protein [Burkholderiales bacterium]|nr:HIT family protein [Burkholderiales bacterium]